MRKTLAAAMFVFATFLGFGSAHATLVAYDYQGAPLSYSYLGSVPDWLGKEITGWVTVDTTAASVVGSTLTIPITAWSFSCGSTFSASNSSSNWGLIENYIYENSGTHNIIGWSIEGMSSSSEMFGIFSPAVTNGFTYNDFIASAFIGASVYSTSAGTWTQEGATVPIPAGILLLVPGLAGLAGLRKKYIAA